MIARVAAVKIPREKGGSPRFLLCPHENEKARRCQLPLPLQTSFLSRARVFSIYDGGGLRFGLSLNGGGRDKKKYLQNT